MKTYANQLLRQLVTESAKCGCYYLRVNESGAEADGHASGQDEAIAAREWYSRDNADTGDSDGAEEESRHATKHGAWNRNERSGELGEDAHNKQPEAASIASRTVGASSERNDTVVLCEGGHGSDGAETSNDSIEAIGQNAALDARVEELAVHFKAGHIASSSDITDGLHSQDDIDC